MTPIIDTHSHLFLEEFDDDRGEVLERCREVGVGRILLPNLNVASLKRVNTLVDEVPDLCAPMIGLHPTEFGDDYDAELDQLEEELGTNTSRYVAIGEIGLDYYWSTDQKEEMNLTLRRQLEWAAYYDLPVSLHARSATMDVIAAIRDVGANRLKGVFHSFTDSVEDLKAILELESFMVGINGVVTFKKCELSPTVKNHLPVERLVVETDSPYLAPVPKRGKRNDPSYLPYIVSYLAALYGMEEEDLRSDLYRNSVRIFGKMD